MNEKKKTTIIVIGCVLAVVIVALVLWYLKKKKEEEKDTEKGASENTAVNTLKAGSRGEEVRRLQLYLNNLIAEHNRNSEVQIVPLEVDGIFGPNTESICKTFLGTSSVTPQMYESLGIE